MSSLDKIVYDYVRSSSPEVAELILKENYRQYENIEIIACVYYPSDAVRAAMASCLTA